MPQSTDMPTVARIRSRLNELKTDDLTVNETMWVLGVATSAPIHLRIQRGEISAAKIAGEWRIDRASVNAYLDKVNNQFNRGK